MKVLPRIGLGLFAFFLTVSLARAQEKAAVCDKVAGVLCVKTPKGWEQLHAKDAIPTSSLVLALGEAELRSAAGVGVTLIGDVGLRGQLPHLEAAVILQSADKVDLDLKLERGVIVIENQKKEGVAAVRFHGCGLALDIQLKEPGTKLGILRFGRLPPGLRTIDPQKEDEEPTTNLVFLVLKGQAFLSHSQEGFALEAPPGMAMLQWNSVDKKVVAMRLDKVPPEVEDEKTKRIFARLSILAKELKDGKKLERQPLAEKLALMLKAKEVEPRQVAVTLAGALDELGQVFAALSDSDHADSRQHAILVLRHWLGRENGQIPRMYKILTEERKLTKVQARSALQLMLGFDDEQQRNPATYHLLIEYLDHSKVSVRELAHWHLIRLAPAGKQIPFDAAASAEDRARGIAAWRALIPEGQLPGAVKKTE